MEKRLFASYLVELMGTFVLVYFAAGVVCVNHLVTPPGDNPGTMALNGHQPGLVGIALAQGLILGVMLAVTVPVSGGYLNPAITIMLWVFNRLDTAKTSWYVGAQLLGAVLAGLCLRYTFTDEVLRISRLGATHLNPLIFPIIDYPTLFAGTSVELILTFSLVLAIFRVMPEGSRAAHTGLAAGAAMTAAVLVGFPLTGAAANPARWFGPFLLQQASGFSLPGHGPTGLVYVAGPVLGAMLAGLVSFHLLAKLAPPGPAPGSEAFRAGAPAGKPK